MSTEWFQKKKEFLGWFVTAALSVAILAWIRRWPVVEDDIFTLVRAGREIIQTWTVQTSETWSFTANGTPWFNIEWLSSVLAYGISCLAPHYVAFYYWRILWMVLCLGLMAWIIRKSAGPGFPSWAGTAVFLPCLFLIMFSRFQMRAELYVTVIYEILLLVWLTGTPSFSKKLGGIGLLLLWANLHGGIFPFGVFLYAVGILATSKRSVFYEIPWIIAAVGVWFLSPIGFHVLEGFKTQVLNADTAASGNIDYLPYSWTLVAHRHGWLFGFWIPFSAFSLGAYAFLIRKNPNVLPALYRNRVISTSAVLLLSIVAWNKFRSVHYQVIFLLPVAASAVVLLYKVHPRKIRWATLGFLALLWGMAIPILVVQTIGMHGVGVADWRFPVKSVEFIKKNKPASQILNDYNFGGYLLAELPEYPVAVDGRELPYLGFLRALDEAYKDQSTFRRFLTNYSIETVLEPYPSFVYVPQFKSYTDTFRIAFPPEEWALVFFDSASVVFVRRDEKNNSIIEKEEYHFIRPGTPPDYPATATGLTNEIRAGWEAEARRCLADNPTNFYCLKIMSAFERARDHVGAADEYAPKAKEANPEAPE